MGMASVFLGILPILVFVIVDSIAKKRVAIWSAIAMALVELLYSLIELGELDELTLLSFATVAVFGLLSIKKNNDLFFKLQPVLFGVFLGMCSLVFYFVLDKPIFVMAADKYKPVKAIVVDQMVMPSYPELRSSADLPGSSFKEQLLQKPLPEVLALTSEGGAYLKLITAMSRDIGWLFLLHAALTAFAALRLSKWWWVAIRVPGFYLLAFGLIFLERALIFS